MADDWVLLGRITDPRALTHVRTLRVTDTTITLDGRIAGRTRDTLTPEHLAALRDQLLGLANNPDEPFQPMVFGKDPTLTQMVRVRRSSVDVGPGDLDPEATTGPAFEVELDRVGNTPSIESTLLGGFRNVLAAAFSSGANSTPWHARPAAALDYYDGQNAFSSGGWTRTSETGDVKVSTFTAGSGNSRRLARWTVAEDHWYDGAATIEQTYPDGNYYRMVGRRPRLGRDTTGWRITNGLLRVYVDTTGKLKLQAYRNGAWGTAKELLFGMYDGVTPYAPNRVNTWAVRRNSPEQVIVRITLGLESGSVNYPHRVTLDLSLRRGDRMVCARMTTAGINLLGSAELTTAETGTVLNSSAGKEFTVRTNSNDADGNRFVLAHTGNTTSSYTGDASGSAPINISMLAARGKAWSFAAGFEVGGTGAASIDTAAAMINQWAAPFGERTTVVGW